MQMMARLSAGFAAVSVVFLLSGCGGSPHAAARPTAVVAVRPAIHRDPAPDAPTQTAIGGVLAVRSVEGGIQGLLSDAAQAQSEQLPDTVNADLSDASRRNSEAEYLLFTLQAPSQFNAAVLDLRMASQSFATAVANRSPQGTQAREGAQELSQADAALRGKTFDSLAGVQRALHGALMRAARATQPKPLHTSRHAVRHAGTHHISHASTHPVALATKAAPRPTPTRAAPVVVVVRVVGKKAHLHVHPRRVRRATITRTRGHHASRRSAPAHRLRHSALPRPTRVPTATAVPTPSPTPVPASVAALAPYLSHFRLAQTRMDVAWRALSRCARQIDGIRTGVDAGGSASIHGCLTKASRFVQAATDELTPIVNRVSNPSVQRHFGPALQNMSQVQSELQSAGTSVDALQLDGAYGDVRAAQARVKRLRSDIANAVARRSL